MGVTVPLLAMVFWAIMGMCNFDVSKGHGHRTSRAIWVTIDTLAIEALGGRLRQGGGITEARPPRYVQEEEKLARAKFGYAARVRDVDAEISTRAAIKDGCKFVLSLCHPGTDEESALPFWVVAVAKGEHEFNEATLASCARVGSKSGAEPSSVTGALMRGATEGLRQGAKGFSDLTKGIFIAEREPN